METLLECTPARPSQPILQLLSHEEIISANKRMFELYSCIDSSSEIYACTLCKRTFARSTTLTRHFKTHVCPHCNEFFEDKADLMEHKYKEGIAGDDKRRRGLTDPMVSKENRELFKKNSFIDAEHNTNRCTLCCKNYCRRTILTRHMKTHICSHCGKFYEDKYDLAKHIISHQQDGSYFGDGIEFVDNNSDDEKYSAQDNFTS